MTRIFGCLLAILALSKPVLASVVFIETEFQSGMGFLRSLNDRCLVITPAHVVEDSYEITAHSQTQRAITVKQLTSFKEDLSILSVPDTHKSICDSSNWQFNQTNFDSHLVINKSVSIQYALMDGSQRALRGYISGKDSHSYFYVKTDDSKEHFQQGMSGSFVFADGIPVGMLISTDNREGRVLRLDLIDLLTQVYFPKKAGSEKQKAKTNSGEFIKKGDYLISKQDITSIELAYAFCREHKARYVKPAALRRIGKDFEEYSLITATKEDDELQSWIFHPGQRRVRRTKDGFDSLNVRAVCEK